MGYNGFKSSQTSTYLKIWAHFFLYYFIFTLCLSAKPFCILLFWIVLKETLPQSVLPHSTQNLCLVIVAHHLTSILLLFFLEALSISQEESRDKSGSGHTDSRLFLIDRLWEACGFVLFELCIRTLNASWPCPGYRANVFVHVSGWQSCTTSAVW